MITIIARYVENKFPVYFVISIGIITLIASRYIQEQIDLKRFFALQAVLQKTNGEQMEELTTLNAPKADATQGVNRDESGEECKIKQKQDKEMDRPKELLINQVTPIGDV